MSARLLVPCVLIALLGAASFALAASPSERLDDVQSRLDRANGKLNASRAREGVLTTEIAGYNARIRRVEGRLAALQPQVVLGPWLGRAPLPTRACPALAACEPGVLAWDAARVPRACFAVCLPVPAQPGFQPPQG